MIMFENNCILDTQLIEANKRYCRQRDIDELSRMYPDVRIQDKLVLFLDFQFFVTNLYSTVSANINMYPDVSQMPKYVINSPFPNKQYLRLSMRRKSKVSKKGIILIFDDFKNLSDIKSITCDWLFDNTHMCVCYDTTFEKPYADNRIYTIFSRDALLSVQEKHLGDDLHKKYNVEQCSDGVLCRNSITVRPYENSLIPFYL